MKYISWFEEYDNCRFTSDRRYIIRDSSVLYKVEKQIDENSYILIKPNDPKKNYVKVIDNIIKHYHHSNHVEDNNLIFSSDSDILNSIQKYSLVLTMNDNRWNIYQTAKSSYTNLNFNKYLGKPARTPIISCKQNHIDMIRYAKSNDWPFVLIFEDDAVGSIDWQNRILEVFRNIPKDAAIIHLGEHQYSRFRLFSLYNNQYYKMNRRGNVWGTHAYIVFKNYYDIVLDCFQFAKAADSIFNVDRLRNLVYIVKKPIFVQFYNDKCEHIHQEHVERGVDYFHYGIRNGSHYDTLDGFPDLRNLRTK